MKGTKAQKGITLVALIITIVILLILAVVAISSIQENGILQYATNAATDYNGAVGKEQGTLQEYEGTLNGLINGWDEYSIGDEVTIGEEAFYVIADSDETQSKVLLLAKECLDTTDLTNLVQSADNASKVAFSTTKYWTAEYGENIVEEGNPDSTHTAAYAAYKYGEQLGGKGRLIYWFDEAEILKTSHDYMIIGTNPSIGYWFSSSTGGDYVIHTQIGGSGSICGVDDSPDHYYGSRGVRPVVEISKAKVTKVTQ